MLYFQKTADQFLILISSIGISPLVHSKFTFFASNITKGGIVLPVALTLTTTVIWALLPDVLTQSSFGPHIVTTFGGSGSSGMPVSSTL